MNDSDHGISSNSGYIVDAFDGIDNAFTHIREVHRSKSNVILQAERYGRRWILKGLTPAARKESHYMVRLRKEFEILMGLHVEGVVKAFSLEQVEGYGHCIVMEWIDGVTLESWLDTAPSRGERRRIGRQIVECVGRIHAAGVVHRDIKPSNIMITKTGVRIIDFGLADTAAYTILKQPAGTRGYISPEQASTPRADIRNDIYSLGKVLEVIGVTPATVISRCKAEIERRYPDTDALSRAIEKRRFIRRATIVALPCMVLAAAIAIALVTAKEESPLPLGSTETVAQEATSPDSVISTVKADTTVSMPANPIPETTSPTKSTEPETRAIPTQVYIDRGMAEMKRLWANCDYKRHLDTLSHYRYHNERLKEAYYDFTDFPDRYMDTVQSNMTADQRSAVHYALNREYLKLVDTFRQRLEHLIDIGAY